MAYHLSSDGFEIAPSILCEAEIGALTLLHASSEAHSPSHRRVIHLEYATGPLDGGLEWAETSKPAL